MTFGVGDILGYRAGRTLSKFILILAAISISTFALVAPILEWLNFNLFGFPLRNVIALSLIIVILLMKDSIVHLLSIPFLRDDNLTKWFYYIFLGLVAISISTWQVMFLNQILDISFLDFSWLAVRNIIAVILLASARKIHVSG